MMRSFALAGLFTTLAGISPTRAAEAEVGHRVIVLDNRNQGADSGARLRLIEVETGRVLAATTTGLRPDVAISPSGELVAVMSNALAGKSIDYAPRLELYRTSDLALVSRGHVPFFGRTTYIVPHFTFIAFAPSGGEVIVQKMMSYLTDERPQKLTVDQAWLATVNLQADATTPLDTFGLSHPPVLIPRCTAVRFLRTADWPRIDCWNALLQSIERVDLATGEIQERLRLSDKPALEAIDPRLHENARIGLDQYMALMAPSGQVISEDGRTAYYVPRSGRLRSIDLSAGPPRVIRVGEGIQADLQPIVCTVSEPARSLFVQVARTHPNGAMLLDSNTIRSYDTLTLAPGKEIETSVKNCNHLSASADGAYVYALDTGGRAISVIDGVRKSEVKILEDVGDHPVLVFPVP